MKKFFNFNNLKWACHHLHIDKSNTITKELLHESQVHMTEKWILMNNIKYNYNELTLKKNMLNTTSNLIHQGCKYIRTHIDIDTIVKLEPLNYALELKNYLKTKNITLQIGTQLLNGLQTQENIDLFYEASNKVDFIGCLPSRDPDPIQHLNIVFSRAKELNLDVEAHLDQQNINSEKETELFCDFVEKFDYQSKSRAIHCISLACHPIYYQKKIAQRLKELDISVIVCPSAAISMAQNSELLSYTHNSIAPVQLLLNENVNVALGVDNVQDIFMPFCDGNLEFELRLLAEAARIYDIDSLTKIATNTTGFSI